MTIGELIEDDLEEARIEGRAEGREEGLAEGEISGKIKLILELLSDKGSVTEETVGRIWKERDPAVLKEWMLLAVKADSAAQFEEAIR